MMSDAQAEVRAIIAGKLRAALDVNNFTVLFLSQLIPAKELPLVQSQIAAAHEAYRGATGEPSWDQMIQERAARRKAATDT